MNTKKERFKLMPIAYLILIKDDKILLSRRFNTGYEDGNYSFVAGHLDGNETFVQAIVRETKEESDISLKPEDLKVVHMMHRKVPGEEMVDCFLTAKKWKGEPKIMEPHKCNDLRWFELDNLPENTVLYIKQAIDYISKNIFYSEFGW